MMMNKRVKDEKIKGFNAINGIFKHLESHPAYKFSDDQEHKSSLEADWKEQWYHWDRLGPGPGSWGDVGD